MRRTCPLLGVKRTWIDVGSHDLILIRLAKDEWAMGYNARNDEIRDNVTRMHREWEAQRGALAKLPFQQASGL